MPIRTDRGRAAATRAFWSWPLRSGQHMLATGVVAATVLTAVALASNALQGSPSSAAAPTASDSAPATTSRQQPEQPLPSAGSFGGEVLPTSSSTSGTPSSTPTTGAAGAAGATSAGSAGALVTAKEFMAHWVRPAAGTTAAQWADGLRVYVMPESIAELDTVDPQNIPATKVTGDPQVTTSSTAVVEANVSTDAGATHLVIVAYTDGRWLVRTWEPA